MNTRMRDQVIRTICWAEAIDFLTSRRAARRSRTSAASVCHATLGLVPYVPQPLRHIGCMWLEDGDEALRCNRPPTWTMGTTLEWPRLYCTEHAERILARRRQRPRSGPATFLETQLFPHPEPDPWPASAPDEAPEGVFPP